MKNPNSYPYTADNAIEYDDDDSDENEENPEQNFSQNGYVYNSDNFKRHPKKKKLESFVSENEFAPRRDTWSEEESSVLLEAWGERYMELGRRSLRAEDWAEVTEKMLGMGRIEKTEAECRSQLDVLKNKYKKERVKVESGHGSKWVFFKKMDSLLNMRAGGNCGLGCGVDSGEYVFMNPRVYLDRSNVLDEMRDSPGESDDDDDDDDDVDEEDISYDKDEEEDGSCARLLAESIQRFGKLYEKIEESKRNQMIELEKMREDFQRELEVQKQQIVERAQAEIAKIREMDDDEDENTDSSENLGD